MYFVTCFSIVLLVLLTDLRMVSSARFKIALPHDAKQALGAAISKRSSPSKDACSDYVKKDVDVLDWPPSFDGLCTPSKQPNCLVATSHTVSEGIHSMFSLKVPGLDGDTIKGVLDELEKGGCLSFPFGGCVRDQFLNSEPNDLDVETDCSNDQVLEICEKKWGDANCNAGALAVHIGFISSDMPDMPETETIDASNWDKTFFGDGTDLEYTTNSITYFAGNLNVTIDLTGNGIDDTCNKKIRIPVDSDHWEAWLKSNGDKPDKVYRYWKLRVKDYTEIDSATKSFIVEKAKMWIKDDNDSFKKFYCKNALLGEWNKPNCVNIENCAIALDKKSSYDANFAADLGDFWEEEAMAVINNLECGSCSTESSSCTRSISPTDVSAAAATAPSCMVILAVLLEIFLVIV